jgi:hypothetical protein
MQRSSMAAPQVREQPASRAARGLTARLCRDA